MVTKELSENNTDIRDIRLAEDVVSEFLKAKKSMKIYPSNNPLYQGAIDALYMRFNKFFNHRELDPCLLKFFVRIIGTYPVGCLVMLDSNELGIVARNNADPEFSDRPRVLIVTDSSGMRVENRIIDLMEKDENGNFRKTITKTLDPNKYVMNLSEYLLLTA